MAANFAEIDKNGIVLKVVEACPIDVANNGGEQSEQAAEFFKKTKSLSPLGVKWVQTSYEGLFRNKYAAIGDTYDSNTDRFISPQPFASWTLGEDGSWDPPVAHPNTTAENGRIHTYTWNEDTQQWIFVE